MNEKGEKKVMKGKKTLTMLLAEMLIFSIIGVANASLTVKYPTPTGSTMLYVGDYEFFDEADLTGTLFNVTVGIYNVTDMKGCEIKLGYNTTLLDATYVYATDITDDTIKWLPVDENMIFHPDAPPTIQDDIGQVWVLAWGFSTFTGSGAVFKITFKITLAPPRGIVTEPENRTVSCPLDLYDTGVLDDWADPIDHSVSDGSYTYIRPQEVVENEPPVALFTTSTTEAYVDETILFDASDSYDPVGTIIEYAWDFESDGIVDAYGVTTEHSYTAVGTYIVNLTVTDDSVPPLSDTTTATITVTKPVVPVPDLVQRKAWPDHKHFVEAKHGTINTLNARMGNKYGTKDYLVYVKFSIYSAAKGIDFLGTIETTSETILAGAVRHDTSTEFDINDSRWGDLAKIYVKAELFYWDEDETAWVESAIDKWFSFSIVRM